MPRPKADLVATKPYQILSFTSHYHPSIIADAILTNFDGLIANSDRLRQLDRQATTAYKDHLRANRAATDAQRGILPANETLEQVLARKQQALVYLNLTFDEIIGIIRPTAIMTNPYHPSKLRCLTFTETNLEQDRCKRAHDDGTAWYDKNWPFMGINERRIFHQLINKMVLTNSTKALPSHNFAKLCAKEGSQDLGNPIFWVLLQCLYSSEPDKLSGNSKARTAVSKRMPDLDLDKELIWADVIKTKDLGCPPARAIVGPPQTTDTPSDEAKAKADMDDLKTAFDEIETVFNNHQSDQKKSTPSEKRATQTKMKIDSLAVGFGIKSNLYVSSHGNNQSVDHYRQTIVGFTDALTEEIDGFERQRQDLKRKRDEEAAGAEKKRKEEEKKKKAETGALGHRYTEEQLLAIVRQAMDATTQDQQSQGPDTSTTIEALNVALKQVTDMLEANGRMLETAQTTVASAQITMDNAQIMVDRCTEHHDELCKSKETIEEGLNKLKTG